MKENTPRPIASILADMRKQATTPIDRICDKVIYPRFSASDILKWADEIQKACQHEAAQLIMEQKIPNKIANILTSMRKDAEEDD